MLIDETIKKAYAFLLVKYLSELEKPHRFLLLGFSDTIEELREHFTKICKGDVIRPSGRLEGLSRVRKSDQACIIALNWGDVGKYASWITSFKILDESLRLEAKLPVSSNDVHNPIDVIKWLLERDDILKELFELISKDLSIEFKPLRYGPLVFFLKEIRKYIRRKPSYAELVHPRKIIEGLVKAMNKEAMLLASGNHVSVGFFFREIGMESTAELEKVTFFNDANESYENIQKEYVEDYTTILRECLARPYEKGGGNLRKVLSNMGLNLLRWMLCSLVNYEIGEMETGKWTKIFLEFEKRKKEKRRSVRKYDVINIYSTAIHSRSPVSGLPTRFQFIISSSKDFNGENILFDFYNKSLHELCADFNKSFGDPHFELIPIRMINGDKLVLELSLEKEGMIFLDPYIKGLSKPTREVNQLLSKLGVR